jgi:4-hydroxy-tetrahydrodipicolinate synthase
MQTKHKPTRREFVGAMAAGVLGLGVPGAVTANIFATGRSPRPARANTGPAIGKKYVPVMITPYKQNGQIDYDTLSKLIDFYTAAGARGLFANCASSEMYALSPDERLALTKHVVRRVGGKISVVATGSFGETPEEKAGFTKKIYDTGVNAVITITGLFAKAEESDAVLMRNYQTFFNLTGNIPLGTYECPSPYKRILTPEVFRFLLKSGRMRYHKDTTIDFDKVKVKIELAKGSNLEFYDACIANTMYSLQAGARGMSPICGNFYPEIVSWMCNNAENPDRQEDVKYIQAQLTKTEDLIARIYPLSAKYFLRKRGLPVELISRLNNDPLTASQQEVLDGVHKTFLGWCDRIGVRPVTI